MVICPNCGAQQSEDATFCEYCGQPLPDVATSKPEARALPQASAHPPTVAITPPDAPLVCPRCGAKLAPDSAFCDMCGVPLRDPRLSPVPTSARNVPAGQQFPAQPERVTYETPPSNVTQPAYAAMPVMQARLVIQATQTVLQLPQGQLEVIIGRADPLSNLFPDVDLTDYGGDKSGVSRQHARIFFQGNQVFVEDRGSTNHTYVNSEKLLPWQPHSLHNGDEVRFGRLATKFYL